MSSLPPTANVIALPLRTGPSRRDRSLVLFDDVVFWPEFPKQAIPERVQEQPGVGKLSFGSAKVQKKIVGNPPQDVTPPLPSHARQPQKIDSVPQSVVSPQLAVEINVPSKHLDSGIADVMPHDCVRDAVALVTLAASAECPLGIDKIDEQIVSHHSDRTQCGGTDN